MELVGDFLTLFAVSKLAVFTLVNFLWLPGIRNQRTHPIKFGAQLTVLALALLEKLTVKLHLDLLHLRWDHVGWHVSQMLLDLDHFGLAQARLAWLVVHFEEFYLFKPVLSLPSDSLGLLLGLVRHLLGSVLVE